MRSLMTAIMVVGLILPSAGAEAREVRRLEPSSEWVLDYADESCRLARHFGTGGNRVILVMDQFEPGDWFTLTFAGALVRATQQGTAHKGRHPLRTR